MAEEKLLKREYYCGKIDENFIGKKITVYGWVNKKRELGGLTFIDLRDREGILQVVINEHFSQKELLKEIGSEYVLSVSGLIIKRSNPNHEIFTGMVELEAENLEILSRAQLPPFLPSNNRTVSEELRFKYRYIDLRNSDMQKNFRIRSEINLEARNYLCSKGFLDIETPMLTKATPEGARDYLVPSRIYKGKMFALPQSPQIFKQLLMVSGFERYFQIVKCFRDEDLRADRQPEFTQIDIEMSFAEKEEIYKIIEGLMQKIFHIKDSEMEKGFKTITYSKAMNDYGTDKPDLRIPFKIRDFTENSNILNSNILNSIVEKGGTIRGICLPEASKYSRKILDQINIFIKEAGGAGVIWIKRGESEFKSSIKTDPDSIEKFYKSENIDHSEIIFLLGDKRERALLFAGKLREFLGRDFKRKEDLSFLWVEDFPLFFYNEDKKRLDSNHHPFTSPKLDEIDMLETEPLKVRSIAYDLVLNGVEIGGGSRRINSIELQKKIFNLLGLSDSETEEKFGFFLNALKYGAPPHLGIALGLDRIIMLLTGEDSIREVISFPKTTSSLCLLSGSPSTVSAGQLDELGIKFTSKP